ncbi:MAG TPA: STAS domain-containing protein [Caulobacteraceae bacterium]|jgi:chemotaxis protein CheX|nr:STAS domain-containing protein [Caulobacteraceae bacterium]
MSNATFVLPAVVDAASVASLRSGLLELRGSDLAIDASGVTRIGGLGLQVLLAAARAWQGSDLAFQVTSPSQPFTEMLRLTGAADLPEFAA